MGKDRHKQKTRAPLASTQRHITNQQTGRHNDDTRIETHARQYRLADTLTDRDKGANTDRQRGQVGVRRERSI